MITIVSVGKLAKDTQKLFNQYVKRISFFTKVNQVQVKEVNVSNVSLQKARETEAILRRIPGKSTVFVCSLSGQQMTSEAFANVLASHTNITFVIGGSFGMDESLLGTQVKKISFSQMTFAHQLFRLLLVEQIFRGFSIARNMKYHK